MGDETKVVRDEVRGGKTKSCNVLGFKAAMIKLRDQRVLYKMFEQYQVGADVSDPSRATRPLKPIPGGHRTPKGVLETRANLNVQESSAEAAGGPSEAHWRRRCHQLFLQKLEVNERVYSPQRSRCCGRTIPI
jgi:hypothetical protein